jgi:hypothetical protein
MMIVGIGYKKHSGKDTLAKYIGDELNRRLVKNIAMINFADQLKLEVSFAIGIPVHEMEANKDVFRPILQWWGTEFKRKFMNNDDHWINAMDDHLSNFKDVSIALIADVRFPNEAEWIKSLGGKLIKITRPELNSIDTHASEIAMDNFSGWDMEVINDGSKEQLLHKAKGIINSLIIPSL